MSQMRQKLQGMQKYIPKDLITKINNHRKRHSQKVPEHERVNEEGEED